MSFDKPIRRIAIVGTGLIGSSWAAQYLARGLDVIATNPDSNAESKLRKNIDAAWKELTIIGLSPDATRDRLTFNSNMKEALSNADFVQENGPESPDFKIKLFAEIDDATPSELCHRLVYFRSGYLSWLDLPKYLLHYHPLLLHL
jgi:3-hydroxyacyl-CoA dehydrogenase